MSQFNLTAFLLLFSCSFGMAQENKWEELDRVLNQLSEDQFFHGAVLLAENNEIQYHRSFGKNPSNQQAITLDQALDIASISKPLTASGILILASKGKLDIDDPVKKHIPEFPFPKIRIRHLLNHTSGMERFLPLLLKTWDTDRYIDNEDILKIIRFYPPLAHPPGQSFHYNNANYTILASVIERISKMSFEDFMEKKVFRPFKMRHTAHRSKITSKVMPATPDNFTQFDKGSSNVLSTVKDLFQYTLRFYSGKKWTRQLTQESFTPPRTINDQESSYGFGWFLESEPEFIISHSGEGHKVSSAIKYYPHSGKMLVVIHPYSNIYFKKVFDLIENIMDGKEYSLPQKRKIISLKEELLRKYIGSYESQFGLLHITLENGKLFLRPDPIPGREELIPSSETTFYFGNQDLEWEFFKDDMGNVIGLGLKGNRSTMGKRQE